MKVGGPRTHFPHVLAVQLYSEVTVTGSDGTYDGHTPPLKRKFDVPAVRGGLVDGAICELCIRRCY